MWISKTKRLAPTELKKMVGKKVVKFSGFG